MRGKGRSRCEWYIYYIDTKFAGKSDDKCRYGCRFEGESAGNATGQESKQNTEIRRDAKGIIEKIVESLAKMCKMHP